jgi:Fe2+ transport system protein FeoA
MSLCDLKRGQVATVLEVPEGELRHKLLRFGLAPGMKVRCHAKLPLGPVVVRFGGQELALGRDIARRVMVAKPENAQ